MPAPRTEHYEIAAYESLIVTARAMGETHVAKLLSTNLAEEKDALKLMKAIAGRLAKQNARAKGNAE